MKYGNLIVEVRESVLLKRLLNVSGYYQDVVTKNSLRKLAAELSTATIAIEEEMPADVIRINSIVTVAADKNWEKQFQIVLPTERDISRNKISVLTPMGAALIGYAQGDEVIWDFPNGQKVLQIKKVQRENNAIDLDILL